MSARPTGSAGWPETPATTRHHRTFPESPCCRFAALQLTEATLRCSPSASNWTSRRQGNLRETLEQGWFRLIRTATMFGKRWVRFSAAALACLSTSFPDRDVRGWRPWSVGTSGRAGPNDPGLVQHLPARPKTMAKSRAARPMKHSTWMKRCETKSMHSSEADR